MRAHGPDLQYFVRCLMFLPNPHTLEIWGDEVVTISLEKALKRVKLPQIETLILSPSAHPILRHCHNVEDVVYAVRDMTRPPDEFLESLESNRNSKIKRLAIPLILWPDPSRK